MNSDPLVELSLAASAWGAPLDDSARLRINSYLLDVQRKNAETNLTADEAWEDLALKHAADGIFAAAALRRFLAQRGAPARPRVLDLGSGGGFIGICLKIAWPEADVTLMESVERKYRFLNAATASLALPGLRPLRGRAGAAPPRSSYETGFDAVVERALAPLPEAVALAFPRLSPGGVFAAFQTDSPEPRDPALARALSGARARLIDDLRYRRPREERDRHLLLFACEEGTP